MDSNGNVVMDVGSGIKSKHIFLGLGAVGAAVLWWYISNPIMITVTGSGIVTVPATYVAAQVTVAATGVDPDSTLTLLNRKIASVREVMVRGGVAEENISQSQPQLTPAALVVAGASGYQASSTLSFRTKYVADSGKLAVDLYNSGATVVSQPVYQVENQESAEKDAAIQALSKAEDESKRFAQSKWKLIRKIVAVQQASSGTSAQSVVKDSKAEDQTLNVNGGVQIGRAVQVTYRMW